MLTRWASALDDVDDGPVFWLALAATQWNYGQLQPAVGKRALEVIDTGADLGRWEGSHLDRRRKVLLELRAKLVSAQPKPKRPRKLKQVPPVPSHEATAPDGRGKAVAFSMPGADFMQIYLEREVEGARGGGSVFMAHCPFDQVDMVWQPGPKLTVAYPREAVVQQQKTEHFFCGEIIPIVYTVKS
jgi:hypothetical protein